MRTEIRGHGTNADPIRPMPRPSLLHLVDDEEVEDLRRDLAGGMTPADFEAKLNRLSSQGLLHQFVAENCRSFFRLLVADAAGAFQKALPAERQRLLRVLAYVRKENDAIADYKPGGFQDDLEEVRAATTEFAALLQAFKEWRLRHQVPALWNG